MAALAALSLTACTAAGGSPEQAPNLPDGYAAHVDESVESAGGTLQVQVDYDTAETRDPAGGDP